MTPQLDEETHVYTVNGVEVPSVTQVLASVGIVDYSFLGADREVYLTRGRAIHVATHYDDEGDLDDTTLQPEHLPYLQAWRKFRFDSGFIPSRIEVPHYNPMWHYCGTPDRVGLMGDEACLVDLKSGTAPWWVAIQTAAYATFFEQPGRFRRIGVELHDDGTYRRIDFACRDFLRDFRVFQAALVVYQAKRTNR